MVILPNCHRISRLPSERVLLHLPEDRVFRLVVFFSGLSSRFRNSSIVASNCAESLSSVGKLDSDSASRSWCRPWRASRLDGSPIAEESRDECGHSAAKGEAVVCCVEPVEAALFLKEFDVCRGAGKTR